MTQTTSKYGFCSRILWSTVSKAFLRSRKSAPFIRPLSTFWYHSLVASRRAVWVESPGLNRLIIVVYHKPEAAVILKLGQNLKQMAKDMLKDLCWYINCASAARYLKAEDDSKQYWLSSRKHVKIVQHDNPITSSLIAVKGTHLQSEARQYVGICSQGTELESLARGTDFPGEWVHFSRKLRGRWRGQGDFQTIRLLEIECC